ncbi:aminoglycoside phosphotransferase family protein [Nocardioides sp.]|uniref:phosphotransferase family protein n=1 Tax=Nocardioides sp. TaxID=35761 RepID=UPI002B537411|nr:aminoglycoside phosphotransferase family protein [Nocardioides sp.]HXH76865.1 aminoglycoside phosphotransferase family protein [Nocardioides sp.]
MYADAIAWAQQHLDRVVTHAVPLVGGMTSTMLALHDESGVAAVLRLIDQQPWRTHGPDLVARESTTQQTLLRTAVPAPASLATDLDGRSTSHPAHLMTLVPGALDTSRCDDDALTAMAALLASIHAVEAIPPPREFQSWAWPAKWVVPAWARRPELWRAAFDVLAADPPPFARVFLHRDFSPRNLLWSGDTITGVVDWVETSTGPAWLDVAHCATNLAVRHDTVTGQRFASAYSRLTGVERDSYWDVMDVVGFLPPPGRRGMFDEPGQRVRLEEHLVWALT